MLGTEPQLDHLRMMMPAATLDPALADAALHGLLTHDPSGELVFSSCLVRDVVYDATPADVRLLASRRGRRGVQGLSPDVGLLGHHHDLAGHAKDAVRMLRKAGDYAAEQLDDAGAGQYYYRALVAVRQVVHLGDDDGGAEPQFVSMLVKLAQVCARAARPRSHAASSPRRATGRVRRTSWRWSIARARRSRCPRATPTARSRRCAVASAARSARAT